MLTFFVTGPSACGDCNGVDCKNCENEIDMDDNSDEEEDSNIYDVMKNDQQLILLC